jgi:hypothetical protein
MERAEHRPERAVPPAAPDPDLPTLSDPALMFFAAAALIATGIALFVLAG